MHGYPGDIDTAEDMLCMDINFFTAETCRAVIRVEDFQVELELEFPGDA